MYIMVMVLLMGLISGLLSFGSKLSSILSMLISLEFIVLFIYLSLFTSFDSMNYFMTLVFLVFSVCEGALGLTMLVTVARVCGGDFFDTLSLSI